jgi:hypothetical protein
MVGVDSTSPAVPNFGPVQVRANAPPPEQRVVEAVAHATLAARHAVSSPVPDSLDAFVSSVRKFAQVLDSTGNVQMAASVSGFNVGVQDVYG